MVPVMILRVRLSVAVLLFLAISSAACAQSIPSSSRSQAAIARVAPVLTRDMAAQGLRFGAPIFIRIFKQSRELEVWAEWNDRFHLFRTYQICDYSGALGPKLREGYHQSPEGFYFVTPERLNPVSQFHLSFNLGFPNQYDRAHRRTSSYLMVHGNCVSVGCYAMTDEKIEEIFTLANAAFRNGQKFFRVHVFPFRMTEETMEAARESKWYAFWRNLKEGFDSFERTRRPPDAIVHNKRYVFRDSG